MDGPGEHPRRLGRYEVEGLIGSGAMGRVYRARDPAVGRLVAVKTIRPEHLDRPESAALVERFEREARAAGALSHPGVVSIFDVGEQFLVMELVEGVDLGRHLASHGPLDPAVAVPLFSEIADAIDTAHAAGVIHRDLKPSNIMVQPDGRPKLMDFGVARLESGVTTKTGEVLGSPSYMAPEQIAGEATGGRADLFSLAVVVYEALTGRRPFEGDTIATVIYRVMNEPAPPVRTWREDLPEALDAVFERALSKAPDRRFASACELIAAIASAAEVPHRELGPSPERVPEPSGRPPRPVAPAGPVVVAPHEERPPGVATQTLGLSPLPRRRRGPLAVVLACAVLVAAAVWLLSLGDPTTEPDPPALRDQAVRTSELSVDTSPRGATVEIDGVAVGETPVVAEVEPGAHVLRVVLEGHAPTTLRLDVLEGEPSPPIFFELAPVVARLELTSDPPGADVFVDAERVGTTPFEGPVPTGRLDILVNRPGVGAWRRSVRAAAGETLAFDAVLRAVAPIGPGADGIWEVGAGVTAPVRVSGAPAPYPEVAERAHIEGTVTVAMVVTEDGRPTSLEVVESGGEVLDQAVLEAVGDWRFEPAQRDGEPVRVRWRVRQHFLLGR